MNERLRQLVVQRAGGHCEYCHFTESVSFYPFQIDHIIAEKHDGPTLAGNLAWSCYYCNTHKGPNIAGWIRETEEVQRLFHPRKDVWRDHFAWHGPLLTPKTSIANVTIKVLRINHGDALAVRRLLLDLGEQLRG